MEKKNVIDEKSINDVNYEQLKKLFPHAVSIDEEGKYSIDAQKLQMSMDPSKANIREDGYGLNWVGKKEAYHKAFAKNYKVLKPLNDDNSKNWDSTENILIKGDNLDALKILRQNYFESVKMIYIDPPYNTKNDGFVYNDNFTSNTEETLEELGYDKEYIDYIENIQGAKTHSGWLSFMYPRLLLAKDLLREDGVIFISIDDNEVAKLRLLCDEVFCGENFVANVIWERAFSPKNDAKFFSESHDYILVYSKNINELTLDKLERTEEANNRYKNYDNDARGLWISDNLTVKTYSEKYDYPITTPSGRIVNPAHGSCWRVSQEKLESLIDDNRIWFGKDGNNVPRLKRFLSEVQEGMVPMTLWKHKDVGHNQEGRQELKSLFDDRGYFDGPKPIRLIQQILKLSYLKDTDIALDFFAGSGTTAHAVMDLNAKDGGNRKFIAVQWAEETSEKSVAREEGYNTIFDITKERINRAGKNIAKGDIGFRTFEVVEDLKQKIYQKPLEETDQKDLLSFTQSVVESTQDILYNLLVAESLPLSTKIETLIEEKLYLASNVALVLGNINIDELIAMLKPKKELEYITVYSPNISDDKFTLECESAVSSIGIKPDKLRFRG